MKSDILWLLPFIGVVAWIYGHVPINRKDRSESVCRLNDLKNDTDSRAILMFPEGTRSPNRFLGTFKKGAFHLALQTNYSVVPVKIKGAYELLPKSNYIPRNGVVTVKFLEPIFPTDKSVNELLVVTHNRIISAL